MDDAAPPVPHVTSIAPTSACPLIPIVRGAFETALIGEKEVDQRIYAVPGYCGRKFRLFLNTLIGSLADARYLEIGIFKGATFCAAINGNKVRAFGIDDWSWPVTGENVPGIFYSQLAQHRPPHAKISVLDQEFRTIDFSAIGKFNVLFYDGNHEEKDQYDGVFFPHPALDSEAVLLVDDWNWDAVRTGTLRAIKDRNLQIHFAIELRTSFNNEIPQHAFGDSDWHNGCFIAVVTKGAC